MNYSFVDFLHLCGSLGLFLFGMTMMSESLQKVAGNRMRMILASMTKNRVMGVLTGLIITGIIQSSSATTVMVVSFVNAGLLTLAESISVIMGANIGTTVTAWLVSIIGFKFSIADIALPLIGVSIPLLFSKHDKRRSIGHLMVGFALLFMGLEFLKNSVPDIKANPELLQFLTHYTGMGFGSVLLFVVLGTLLTIVLQSSSATMAITLVMLNQQWIPFELGAAMVLGENIGTTITANLAALTTNANARRAALSHTFFNVFGVIWVLFLFYPFINLVQWVIGAVMAPSAESPLLALSLFHTMFNVINVCLMIWFIGIYEKMVTYLIKDKKKDKEFALQFISSNLLSTPELSLFEAEKEMEHYTHRTIQMFEEVRDFSLGSKSEALTDIMARMEQYENSSDQTELAIANYLYSIINSSASTAARGTIRNYLYLASEIESIADRCYNMARTTERKISSSIEFTEQQNLDMHAMFNLVSRQLDVLEKAVQNRLIDEFVQNEIFAIERDINELRLDLRTKNVDRVNCGDYSFTSGTQFMDIIEECESLADAITKIAKEVSFQ